MVRFILSSHAHQLARERQLPKLAIENWNKNQIKNPNKETYGRDLVATYIGASFNLLWM